MNIFIFQVPYTGVTFEVFPVFMTLACDVLTQNFKCRSQNGKLESDLYYVVWISYQNEIYSSDYVVVAAV